MRPFLLLSVFLWLCAAAVTEDLLELLILHNNDMHSRFEETSRSSTTCRDKSATKKGCVGGLARTVHEVRRYRRMAQEGTGRPVLYLNAGDTFTGTAWFSVHRWRICAEFMNILKPDVMSLGNHEFDDDVAGLAPYIEALTSPTVAANLDFSKEPSLSSIKKSVTLEVSGRKIGIVGHLTEETKIIALTGNVIFTNLIESIRNETEELDRAGVKIIIVLGHSGYVMDKKIAAQVPLADVVVGGHTNTFLWNGVPPDSEKPVGPYPEVVVQKSGKKVPVVQAYAFTKYLGRLNVTFDKNGDLVRFGGQPELLENSIPQDQDVLDVLEKYRKEVEELDHKVVGKSRTILDSTTHNCRLVECNFGNLIADAFVYYMASQTVGYSWNEYPIALVNGGGIRTTIDPTSVGGNITRGELLGAIPFASSVIALTLNGSDLIKTLELGIRSNGETSRGEFLQVSGLYVTYDMSKPTGSRVVSVLARCGKCKIPKYAPVIPHELYNVVTLSFLVAGGDGHYVLKDNGANKKEQDLGDIDLVAWYIAKQSPVYPELQGRIQFVEEGQVPSKSSTTVSYPLIFIVLSVFVVTRQML